VRPERHGCLLQGMFSALCQGTTLSRAVGHEERLGLHPCPGYFDLAKAQGLKPGFGRAQTATEAELGLNPLFTLNTHLSPHAQGA
jgi:hypothetical protein